jgi:hypothetical protein
MTSDKSPEPSLAGKTVEKMAVLVARAAGLMLAVIGASSLPDVVYTPFDRFRPGYF